MDYSTAPCQQPARQADLLGWFGGLVVGTGGVFGLTLAYIVVFEWGQLRLDITWADHLAAAAWAVQAPLALWGLVGTVRAAWRRRFGRAVVWLLFTAWALLVLVGGSVVLAMVVFGGAPSVGDPPGVNNL
ncbi:hypothetical protein LJ737_02610 [Hymenobacter sp. 15J16-1T3B]|uniref:hypothetical protein n=1 Tax=Hymenobacter sp. 15J16-1T3B TaxID=2886941 RepID=UPI001D109401|nr:hypothetical protein [Hymenobacter sp. 15J16-1T3B]MCC3156108.1 hypothetical protein [Hymenobacter sp. 15J16-1T3B]